MIYAYPTTVINRYQTHKDYYRISAVSGISGGKQGSNRTPSDFTYERSTYKQWAQNAAQGLSDLVQSAQNAKQLARKLAETQPASLDNAKSSTVSEETEILQPIHEFINAYNKFQDNLSRTPEYLNRSIFDKLEASVPSSLNQLGIEQLADGTLQLDEGTFKKQAGTRNNEALPKVASFAESLSRNLEKLEGLPSKALLQIESSPFKPYGQYRSLLQAYLPIPMNGLLIDKRM